jgi:hypothetical protein
MRARSGTTSERVCLVVFGQARPQVENPLEPVFDVLDSSAF